MHLNRDWTMQECSRKASVVPMWSHGGGPNVVPRGWSQCGPIVVPMVEQCMGEGRASAHGLATSEWT